MFDDEAYEQARKALDVLRRAAWKANLRGVKGAMEALDVPLRELSESWLALVDRELAWRQVNDGDIDGDREEFRDDLLAELNTFDETLKALLGPSKFEVALNNDERVPD